MLSFILRGQHSFSLEEAQSFGLQNNIEIQNAYLNVKHASKQMLETVSIGLPQIHAVSTDLMKKDMVRARRVC